MGIVTIDFSSPQTRWRSPLDAALYWAGRGEHVFPCQLINGEKKPLVRWTAMATNDLDQVERWWRDYWPDAWVGCIPGRSGKVVFDVDVKNGSPGADNWNALGVDTTNTRVVRTRSLGGHVWFNRPAFPVGNYDLCPGVNVRCDNGYVVMPGFDNGYFLEQWREPADMPPMLIDMLRAVQPTPENHTVGTDDLDPLKHDWRAVVAKYRPGIEWRYLRTMYARRANCAANKRSSMVFAIATQLFKAGASVEEVAAVVWRSPYFIDKYSQDIAVLVRELNNIAKKID